MEAHSLYVLLYGFAAAVSIVVMVVALQSHSARGAVSLAAMMLGVTVWAATLAVMWQVPGRDAQLLWYQYSCLGTWIVPVAFLTLAFELAGLRQWLSALRVVPIAVVSFLLANVGWRNPSGSYYSSVDAFAVGPFTAYGYVPGSLYWVYIAYAYTLTLVGFAILLRVCLRSSGTSRRQAAVLLFGGLVPFAASVVTETGIVSGVDLAPLALMFTGVVWLYAIMRGTLLGLLRVARGDLLEQMPDGILVLDEEGRVADANPAALLMLRTTQARAIGSVGEEVLGRIPGAKRLLEAAGAVRAALPSGSDGTGAFVDVSVTPVSMRFGGSKARLVTLHDLTEESKTQARLRSARRVFDTTEDGILIASHDGSEVVVDVNGAYSRMTGWLRENTVGRSLSSVLAEREATGVLANLGAKLLRTGEWTGEVLQVRADGSTFPSRVSVIVAGHSGEEQAQIIVFLTDLPNPSVAKGNSGHDGTGIEDLP